MNRVVCVLVFSLYLLSFVQAHSWLQCADYSEENGQIWDANKCRGWPRAYASSFQYVSPPYLFGGDAGYNYQPTNAKPCKSTPSAGDYTSTYPKATYNPGQKVCLGWPAKNHVAANCNNANIPDSGTYIYRSGKNPTNDPTLDQFKQNLVFDFGKNTGTNGLGFQNCPNFCASPDKCLCTGCFTVPSNLELGSYTFMWLWAFNGDNDMYTSCFDVDIVANSGKYITSSKPKVTPDEYKAGGGNTVTGVPTPTPTTNTNNGGNGSPTPAAGSPTPAPGPCFVGTEGCQCTSDKKCNDKLVCASNYCVDASNIPGFITSQSPQIILSLVLVAIVAIAAFVF